MKTCAWTGVLAFGVTGVVSDVQAATVFTGFDVVFSKSAFSAETDVITSSVAITRGDNQGIYNATAESSYDKSTKLAPAGTAWAFGSNNPGETISAANWASLTFEPWAAALGGAGQLLGNITAGPGVLYLADEDVYLDIRFTEWGVVGGGPFVYERSAVPEPAGVLGVLGLGLLMRRR
ncbi:hypothetical protein [Mucisphaera calidilacus]|uniref:PEP-CTERM protein-sorting domain-containing protein n=1 Tax=Mucisphaera calidilacus TaxID=2527982 RepID=A0A518C014_9BACT|nr:hypothetical protein [Mucisphaera calidilacus]QDU72561.1 hypothetical protein Pan265_24310 [Mucisphaera calidilacus]